MRCPWELIDRDTLEWDRCSEDWPHTGIAHKIGRFVLHTKTLEILRERSGLARRLW